jgi:RHS repeat-associated protein
MHFTERLQEYDGDIALYYYNARWYDAHTGTFLSRDPLGLAPDVNPYRYVLNAPTILVDPRGLVFVPVPPPPSPNVNPGSNQPGPYPDPSPSSQAPTNIKIGGDFRGEIVIGGACAGDAVRTSAIVSAVRGACNCIAKALDLMINNPKEVARFYEWSALDSRILSNPLNHKRIIDMLKRVRDACDSADKIRIVCDRRQSTSEREAYVNFFWGTNIVSGSVIHVCPLFFARNSDRQGVIIHEMGRFFLSLGEAGTGTWNDVYLWDAVVTSLCGNYDRIKALSQQQ